MVREFGIHRYAQNSRIPFLELLQRIGECEDFSRADKREVQRIEKQNNLFAFELAQRDLPEAAVHVSFSLEIRSELRNKRCHLESLHSKELSFSGYTRLRSISSCGSAYSVRMDSWGETSWTRSPATI